jgi:hypothetical protein
MATDDIKPKNTIVNAPGKRSFWTIPGRENQNFSQETKK